jgi:nucleotide sugar dehydrogenase
MSSTLHVKPENIDTDEKRARYKATVVGCDPNGVIYSCLLAEAGFKVTCADVNQTLVALLAKGKAPFNRHSTEAELRTYVKNGRIVATGDIKTVVSQSDIIMINTPVRFDQKRKTDDSDIQKTCKLVGASLRQGSMVIVASTVGAGVVEGTLREILENTSGFKIGTEIGLAYSPIQTSHDQSPKTALAHGQIVAACDETSLNAAATILETVSGGKELKKTLSVKSAEIAVLFRAAQREVDSALGYEFAVFCEKAKADYLEVERLLKTEVPDMHPSLASLDGSSRNACQLLLQDAEDLSVRLRTVTVAGETDEEMAKHVANLVGEALRNCGKSLRRAKVSILGISEAQNMRSPPKRLAKKLAKIMGRRGAKIRVYDPYFTREGPEGDRYFKKTLTEAIEGTDCILLITAHDQFRRLGTNKLKLLMKMPAAIVDLEGVFEPDKVEKEGFIYRGLGRGVWTR